MSARFAIGFSAAAACAGLSISASAGEPSARRDEAVAEEAETPDLARNVPFYGAGGRKLVAPEYAPPPRPPAPPPPAFFLLGLTGRFERLFVPSLQSEGSMYELSVYLGGRGAGAVIGLANIGGQLGITGGVSILQFSSGVSLYAKNTFRLSLLVPDIDIQASYFFEGDRPEMFMARVTTDLLGLRVAGCLGGVTGHLSVRGPTVGGGFVVMEDKIDFMAPVGVLVDGGFLF